ncbi:MAG TPA: ECF-type sigma factor [Candidatus Krumholzibacteria bacterium]|nr:ECF-type sigma factor [Candidatus Krumholzibacteria bacterium]
MTRLFRQLEDDAAPRVQPSEEIFALVSDALHRTSRSTVSQERADHTLQPTALVHGTYIRLVDAGGLAQPTAPTLWASRRAAC